MATATKTQKLLTVVIGFFLSLVLQMMVTSGLSPISEAATLTTIVPSHNQDIRTAHPPSFPISIAEDELSENENETPIKFASGYLPAYTWESATHNPLPPSVVSDKAFRIIPVYLSTERFRL